MRKLHVLEWNVNFGANDKAEPADFLPAYIRGMDVVILTETRCNPEMIHMMEGIEEYSYICSADQGRGSNQIIMLAKRELVLRKVKDRLGEDECSKYPDFLHGVIEVDGNEIDILGARIKIQKNESWAHRMDQFVFLRDYLKEELSERKVIVAGDFNCGQIRGADSAEYADVEAFYQYRNHSKEPSDLRHYNFHLIKKELGNRYTLRETMGEDNSWGLALINGDDIIYGWGFGVKNDLIFFSKELSGQSRYSWEHVRDHSQIYRDMLFRNQRKRGNHIEHGYPDHARLIAEIEI